MIYQIVHNLAKRAFYFYNWLWFLFIQKGAFAVVDASVRFNNPRSVSAGKNSSINSFSFFDTTEGSVSLGESVKVGDNCRFTTSKGTDHINIGDFTSVHGGCHFAGEVEIGKNCLLARNIFLSSGTHEYKNSQLSIKEQDRLSDKKDTSGRSRKIVVGDDVWLGWGVVVLPGVTIAKGCVIGANAVVTKNTEAFGVYAGVPARKISARIP